MSIVRHARDPARGAADAAQAVPIGEPIDLRGGVSFAAQDMLGLGDEVARAIDDSDDFFAEE